MKRALIYVAVGLLALASGAFIANLQAQPIPTIPAPRVTPDVIPVNTPTQVTVTIAIVDSRVIPTGVNLLRLNSIGSPINLGRMYDDGTHGDALAADGFFTILVTFTEPQIGEIQLQVSSAFKGLLRRTLSSTVLINASDFTLFRDEMRSFRFYYPISLTPIDQKVIRPSAAYAKSFSDANETLHVTVYDNPSRLQILSWFNDVLRGNEYSGAFDTGVDYVDSITEVAVNGHVALSVIGTVFDQRAQRLFFAVDDSIVEFEDVRPDSAPPSALLLDIANTFEKN